ncbi:hypothetical protein CJF31_00002734 [Rutstroemia sp. NJR-2017a BVV2]|nr:hypothetical protein CJF31_00002734 [Rutstroemia sp. NJR-2017a BVV2]PQE14549.1 hypothetical protein CJF30_00007154 [Rutstroemia sp. NJR-2017a BBW]PQE30822.1 hypothetical protein CJF32_00006012 [Rutstroemia sp. NJR-2017a WRK4]
MKKQIY